MTKVTLFLSMFLLWAKVSLAQPYQIGVYYFPGWKANQVGNAHTKPWDLIKPFPDREPLLGWYEEDQPGVMKQQLKWMREAGLSFVVFDWLWGPDNKPYLDHGVNAYLAETDKQGMSFAILWANHTDYIFSKSQFSALFNFWSQRYFSNPNYLRIDGKPAVFIFSAQVLVKNAQKIGITVPQLLAMADVYAKRAGLPGIALIGGIPANVGGDFDYSPKSGFAAFSAYNLHGPATRSYEPGRHLSHSYAELDAGYQDHWNWMLTKTSSPYILPITAGWDKRPWGGSKDPLHDQSRPSAQQFQEHLKAAKLFLDRDFEKTKGMGVICCWNEFGEGSFIEPTKGQQLMFIEQIKLVFKK